MLMLPSDIQFFVEGPDPNDWSIYDYPAWIECDCANSPDCLLKPLGSHTLTYSS